MEDPQGVPDRKRAEDLTGPALDLSRGGAATELLQGTTDGEFEDEKELSLRFAAVQQLEHARVVELTQGQGLVEEAVSIAEDAGGLEEFESDFSPEPPIPASQYPSGAAAAELALHFEAAEENLRHCSERSRSPSP
jgi:hypothetical protein